MVIPLLANQDLTPMLQQWKQVPGAADFNMLTFLLGLQGALLSFNASIACGTTEPCFTISKDRTGSSDQKF